MNPEVGPLLIHLWHNRARTETDLASTADMPSMRELLGVKEEDVKQNQREKTAYVITLLLYFVCIALIDENLI